METRQIEIIEKKTLTVIPDSSVIIASFPKCGNTWVRFLIANLYNGLDRRFENIDFYNIHQICPEINMDAIEVPCFEKFPYIFKSHNQFDKRFKNIILILRHPMDALYSYFYYLNNDCDIHISLSDVVRHNTYGVDAMVSFLKSYESAQDVNILVTTYELLHKDPVGEFSKIVEFMRFEFPYSYELLQDAVKKASFDSMRRIETVKGRKFGSKDFLFTRSGRMGEGVAAITALDRDIKTAIVSSLGGSAFLRKFYAQDLVQHNDVRSFVHLGASANGESTERAHREELRDSAITLMLQARQAVDGGRLAVGLGILSRAKSLRIAVMGLDLMRALCFLRMNRLGDARQSLLEELRYFPGNADATRLLSELNKEICEPESHETEDPEFENLLQAIQSFTMLSRERLYSLFSLAKSICERNIPGNFVECGVAAGGSSAVLAYVIKRYSKSPRRLFAFDSFSGMPKPSAADTHAGQAADDTGWGTGTCAAPEDCVREVCAKLGVGDVLKTVKGYFEATLPNWRDRVGMVALLHLDGDWYESTKAILENLYDRLSNDSILQVDDYGHWEGCRKAIHEFEQERNLKFSITSIDATGVWFQRPDRFPANPIIPKRMIEEFEQVDPIPMGVEGQMSPNERFQLFCALREMLPHSARPLRFVEVGSFAGGSLALTYLTLRKTGLRVQGFSVDPGRHPSLLRILEQFAPDIKYLPMFSHEAAPLLARTFGDGNLPEIIVIDGDHTLMGVRQDIQNYWPLLASGGIMLFHDWLPPLDDRNREAIFAHHGGAEPGIRQACAELLEDARGLSPLEIPLLYPTDPTQTQAHLPIIPGVFSSIRAYRKPAEWAH